jgi:hypothetical protein
MDVSYSAWRHAIEEKAVLKGDSFSFLFDRRYANRLNRMSRVFFEAYAKATSELAAQEDRFPSLSEIDAKMVSGAVYAFKDRLMKNTEFFEEVKISGVSYLVPRARHFVDVTGTYTDLIFNFADGTVILPTRRKVPSPMDARLDQSDELSEPEPSQAFSAPGLENGIREGALDAAVTYDAAAIDAAAAAVSASAAAANMATKQPETYEGAEDESYAEVEGGHVQPAAKPDEAPRAEPLPAKAEPLSAKVETAQSSPGSFSQKEGPSFGREPGKQRNRGFIGGLKPNIIYAIIAALAIILIGAYVLPNVMPPSPPPGPSAYVFYSASLMNSTVAMPLSLTLNQTSPNGSNLTNLTGANLTKTYYLELNVRNPEGMINEVEMVLPKNIDQSISASGGIVTIGHTNDTLVRLNSSGDANVKIYLNEERSYLSVTLFLMIPDGYDSNVAVHTENYDVKRQEGRIILKFNCTSKGTEFEQTYTKSR